MPEVDSYEVCRQLKANEATRHIPLIILIQGVNSHSQM